MIAQGLEKNFDLIGSKNRKKKIRERNKGSKGGAKKNKPVWDDL